MDAMPIWAGASYRLFLLAGGLVNTHRSSVSPRCNSKADIMRWTRTRKEGLLKMPWKWRRQYQIETKLDAKKQRALTKFGHSFALFVAGALGNVVEEYGVRCAACHL